MEVLKYLENFRHFLKESTIVSTLNLYFFRAYTNNIISNINLITDFVFVYPISNGLIPSEIVMEPLFRKFELIIIISIVSDFYECIIIN